MIPLAAEAVNPGVSHFVGGLLEGGAGIVRLCRSGMSRNSSSSRMPRSRLRRSGLPVTADSMTALAEREACCDRNYCVRQLRKSCDR